MRLTKRRLFVFVIGLAFILQSPCSFFSAAQKLPVGPGNPVTYAPTRLTEDNAKDIRELARWGNGVIESADYTPDGRYLIVSSSIGMYVYFADRLKLIRFIDTGEWVTAMAISPDGDEVAASTRLGAIGVWRIRSGVLRYTLDGHTGRLSALAFSPNSEMLASCATDGTVKLWKLNNQSILASQKMADVMDLTFSPDGQTLAVTSGKNIRLLSTKDLSFQSELRGNNDTVNVIKFSPNGKIFASGCYDGKIIVWQVADWSIMHEIKDHTWGVSSLFFARDSRGLFSSSNNGTLIYSDTRTGDKTWSYQPGNLQQTINYAAIKDDLRTLLTVSSTGAIGRWSPKNGEWETVQLDGFYGLVNSTALSPDGQNLISASQDSRIRIWSIRDGKIIHESEIKDHGAVMTLEYSPDGNRIALGYEDGMVYLLHSSGTVAWEAAIGSEVRSIAFSKDKSFVAVASQKNGIQFLQAMDGAKQWSIAGAGIDFVQDGKTFAVGTENGIVEIWELGTMSRLRELDKDNEGMTKVTVSPDGKILVAYSRENRAPGDARLIRMDDGYFITALWAVHQVIDLAFSPDSLMIAPGKAEDGAVQLWRTKDGYGLARLTGHTWNVNSVNFTPDGELMITGSNDGTIRIWGIPQGGPGIIQSTYCK